MTVQITFEFEETKDGWEAWTVQGADGPHATGDSPGNAIRNVIDEIESDGGVSLSQSDVQLKDGVPVLTDSAIERVGVEGHNE